MKKLKEGVKRGEGVDKFSEKNKIRKSGLDFLFFKLTKLISLPTCLFIIPRKTLEFIKKQNIRKR